MDGVIYWMGFLLEVVLLIALLRLVVWGMFWLIKRLYGVAVNISGWSLFLPGFKTLTLRTANLELHLNNVRLSVKWLDPTCRHFIKLSVAGVHLEYYRASAQTKRRRNSGASQPAKSESVKWKHPSFRKKLLYWCLSKLLRLSEISVDCLEVLVEDTLTPRVTLLWIIQVTGHVGVIAKPLPNKELGVSIDIEKASGRYYLQSDRPCPSTDDGLYPLGEVSLSAKILLFLRPLRPPRKGLLHSLQINTLPLSITFIHEDLVVYLVQHLLSVLPSRDSTPGEGGDRKSQVEAAPIHESLPEFEIVLEVVSIFYQGSSSNRVLSSKLTRVSVATKFSSSVEASQSSVASLGFSTIIGIQGVTAADSLSRKTLSLKQILLHTEKSSDVLSNELQVRSLHTSLWDGEAIFWSKCILANLLRTRDKLRVLLLAHNRPSAGVKGSKHPKSISSVVGGVLAMPLSVVTTVEASDWSLQCRTESPSLQSKRPLVRGVMAACVGNVQWSRVQDHSTSVRASLRVSDAYLHVPGFHPSIDNPVFFQQRVDDPSIVPSLRKHLWGRMASLGHLTLQVEKKLHIRQSTPSLSGTPGAKREEGHWEVHMGDQPLVLSGEARSLMLEWSEPTVMMVAKVLDHCLREYTDMIRDLAASSSSSSSSSFSSSFSSASNSSFQSDASKETIPRSSAFPDRSSSTDTATLAKGSSNEAPAMSPSTTINSTSLLGDNQSSSFTSTSSSYPASASTSAPSSSSSHSSTFFIAKDTLPSICLQFHMSDVNVFLYGLTPEPPALMLRLDAASLLAPPPDPSPSHTFSLALHDLLLDDLRLPSWDEPFLCLSVSNLPSGSGVGVADAVSLKYDHQLKSGEVDVGEVSAKWTTTAHCCLSSMATGLRDQVRLLQGVWRNSRGNSSSSSSSTSFSSPSSSPPPEVLCVGAKAKQLLLRVPLSLTLSLKRLEAVAALDKRAKVLLELNKVKVDLNGGVLLGHSQDLTVQFDQRKIVQVQQVVTRFPHSPSSPHAEGTEGRDRFKGRLSQLHNEVINVQVSRLELVFPHGYHFSQDFDKLLNIKRFLQDFHSTPGADGGGSERPLLLAPDLLLECEDFLFQLCEDPFEAKLRANYELMCDEYEQKTQRLQALQQKIGEVKKQHGEYAMSGQAVQNIYESLELKDSEIYCQRAKKLYESAESLETIALFQLSMSGIEILAMSDSSMLGREKLVACVKEMDSISPWPEGNYQFSTLWGGYVQSKAQKFTMQVRDYPCPLIDIAKVTISGRIVFAEQEAQDREIRLAVVEVGHPWKDVTVRRKLPPLKYIYDFEMTSSSWDLTYGSSMEPGLAQTSNGFNLLTSTAVDPSRPLAYWDKLRLLFHGTIHLKTDEMKVILPTTFNPYNSVEYLELKMMGLDLSLLTNTKLTLEGAVQLLVHTASKYDECAVLDFPHASASISLGWVVSGDKNPNRHHHVVRCAPDRLPLRLDNQEHDSYSSFRSLNLDLDFELTVHPEPSQDTAAHNILLYSNTLRYLQQYQMLLKWNVSRPTKRGKLFNNVKKWLKRPPLLRHWRNVKLSLSLPKTRCTYWSSQAKQRGMACSLEKAELSLSLNLTLVPVTSDLHQRHRSNWTISRLSGCGQGIRAHIKQSTEPLDVTEASALKMEEEDFVFVENSQDHVTSMLLSVEKITYSRQETTEATGGAANEYTHKLEATDTHLLWNSSNRNVVFGLYDAFKQAQELKRYLSTEALKSVLSKDDLAKSELEDIPQSSGDGGEKASSPVMRSRHSSSGNTMLDQLLHDISNKYVKFVDERAPSDPQLKGIAAINMDDITSSNWLITLINTQIVLQGIEQWGYVVASSHKANIFGCDHEPRMKNGVNVSKTSWVGKIQELQYFTTQAMREPDETDYVPWLPLSVILPPGAAPSGVVDADEKRQTDVEANLNALLGTLGPSEGNRPATPMGEAMGGTVGSVRLAEEVCGGGEEDEGQQQAIQLQRVAPRCHCQVIYVTYGDQVEAEIARSSSPASPTPRAGALSSKNDVDTFTFRYPSVEVCTTSYQYALLMDIINNLLLSKELKRKEVVDHHARMQFALQLSSKVKDPRKAVLSQQNKVKKCLQAVREAETALFLEGRRESSSAVSPNKELIERLEGRLTATKEEMSAASLKLSILVKTFRQSQLYLTSTRAANLTVPSDPTRRIEIWLDDAHWSLTASDGQLQLADICLTNFSYNRLTFSDDSGEHRLELGTFKVQNLLPNTSPIYQQVLSPYDPKDKHLRVDKNVTLRVYCKDKAPVAGISVKEHLEVNVVPLTVSLTSRFFQTMQDFFFPKAEEMADMGEPDHSHLFGPTGVQPSPHYGDCPDGNSPLLRGSSVRRSTMSTASSTSSYAASGNFTTVNPSPPQSPGFSKRRRIDDVEKMKDRATKTKTFIYIKIPQTALNITYKNEHNVSFKDLQNQRVNVPTLEYHNKNWTWTDMLMELKKDYRSVIVQQTLKSAIGMRGSDEVAGLVSPKARRHASHGDILLYNPQVAQGKSGKGKKLLGRLSSRDSEDEASKGVTGSSSASYVPPLTEPDSNFKRTMRNITKLSQNVQK